jgi:phosphoglycolate phosphatase-like HAD superfamily hydrolase
MPVAIFDMDGTLVRNDDLAVRAAQDGVREYYRLLGVPPRIPEAGEILSLVGLPAREYFAGLVPPERRGDVESVMQCVQRCEVERLEAGEGRAYPGVERVLGELRRDGWRIGLASNCMRPYLDGNLDHVLRREWFEIALCLDHHPTKTENVREAVRILGGPRGVMIGDRSSDLEAGAAAGLDTIGCVYGYGGREEVAGADLLVESLEELPGVLRGGRWISGSLLG